MADTLTGRYLVPDTAQFMKMVPHLLPEAEVVRAWLERSAKPDPKVKPRGPHKKKGKKK